MNAVVAEFDRAVALRRTDEGCWEAEIQDGWDFGGTPNGGYLLAIVAAALSELTGRPDPITITAYYRSSAFLIGPTLMSHKITARTSKTAAIA